MSKAFRILTALTICLCSSLASFAQEGTWSGELDVQGMKLPLVFHFTDEGCTMDSPSQGAKGIKTEWKRADNGDVNVSIPMIGAEYNGKLMRGKIMGFFKQNGMQFYLNLSPGEKKANRPQTPQPPYPYTTEQVEFANGDAVLKGTLTLPEGYSENTPVLIMITGSGLQNRDEELFEHKPFAVIADALARNGIATLRYDDRGFGESTGGSLANATTEVLKNDAQAGVELLRKRFKRVGAIGHSEGGTIAMMLAADRQVDFIVSLAGMAISGKETLLAQNQKSFSTMGIEGETAEKCSNVLNECFDKLIAGGEPPVVSGSGLPQALEQSISEAVKQMATPYFRYFLALDGRTYLKAIQCPVLAMNGKLDMQVDCVPNLETIDSLLKGDNHRVVAFDGLNHLFQHCTTGAVTEYSQIEETFAPEVIEEIISWIKGLP